MSDKYWFAQNLIKGRIAETIFEQMFQNCGKYTVLRAGYEHIMPEIAQFQGNIKEKEILTVVRNAPDFVLFSKDRKRVEFVEVKYRTTLVFDDVLKWAQTIHDSWPHVHIFIATPVGFYMDRCEEILSHQSITPISEEVVSQEMQDEYLEVLRKFLVSVDV